MNELPALNFEQFIRSIVQHSQNQQQQRRQRLFNDKQPEQELFEEVDLFNMELAKDAERINNANLKCPVCFNIIKQTTRLLPCRHLFCSDCISSHRIANAAKCPMCRKEFHNTEVCSEIDNIIQTTLILKCPFGSIALEKTASTSPTCDYEGSIADVKQHLRKCLYAKSNCKGCHQSVLFADREAHKKICDFRVVTCVLCDQSYPSVQSAEHVKTQCPYQSENCPQCSKPVARIDKNEHLQKQCAMRTVQCMACKTSVPWQSLEKHQEDQQFLAPHVAFLLKRAQPPSTSSGFLVIDDMKLPSHIDTSGAMERRQRAIFAPRSPPRSRPQPQREPPPTPIKEEEEQQDDDDLPDLVEDPEENVMEQVD